MCDVLALHFRWKTKTTRDQVTTQSNISKFALLNSVGSLEHEVSLLYFIYKGLHFVIKLTS